MMPFDYDQQNPCGLFCMGKLGIFNKKQQRNGPSTLRTLIMCVLTIYQAKLRKALRWSKSVWTSDRCPLHSLPFGCYLSSISNTFKKQAVVKFLKQEQPLMFLAKNMLFFCFWYATTNVVSQKSQFYNADSA